MTNLTSGGALEQIVYLVGQGVLGPMCDLLTAKDDKAVCVILDGISNILSAAKKLDEQEKVRLESFPRVEHVHYKIQFQVGQMIEELEGLDKLEALQSHENEAVYEKALDIIQTYFAEDDEGEEVISFFVYIY